MSKDSKMTSILAENLSVYANGTEIVSNASFSVPRGQITTIIGANGAGKSTLLKALIGDAEIRSGSVSLNAQAIVPNIADSNRARTMAFLPQLSLLNFPYTVEEVVKLGRIPHKTGEQIDSNIVKECLQVVEMQDFSKRVYPQLSGGEKQRVQIARVLAQIWRAQDSSSPRVLLLDEPNASLDLGHQKTLMQFLQQFARDDVSILMVLHSLNTAANYSDQLIAMHAGQVLTTGTPQEVLQPGLLHELFGVECQIMTNPTTGKPFVLEE